MDFKIRVVENIGVLSKKLFGVPNTEFDVINGSLVDLEGFEWEGEMEPFQNIDDVNNVFGDDDPWQTVFELVETAMNKKNVTLQDYLDNYEMKGEVTIIENGQVVGIKNEE